MAEPHSSIFSAQRAAALSLLTKEDARLTRKAGSFLGQLAVDPVPMSQPQADWLATLLERAALPPFSEVGHV